MDLFEAQKLIQYYLKNKRNSRRLLLRHGDKQILQEAFKNHKELQIEYLTPRRVVGYKNHSKKPNLEWYDTFMGA